ncbi:hypothetical protein Nepgr_020124 [Nepenthes gracilis]|uniref:Uncharacterized protein n=1 Tax=Nepenthes gracilis TaxID=150966 RepID=A0AAD3XUZ4_NEPGR|nr:hypothetical protein Nepgr_020124 [Nepenthes gracilis]
MISVLWMDACEAKEELYSNTEAVNTLKPPLVPAEKNNGVTTLRSRTREIGSRAEATFHPIFADSPIYTGSRFISRACNVIQKDSKRRSRLKHQQIHESLHPRERGAL